MSNESKDLKKPLSHRYFDLYYHAFQYVESYIRSIKLENGVKILHSRNKTGFLGFLVNISSIRNLYNDYCAKHYEIEGYEDDNCQDHNQSYRIEALFTYRLSQDHIETLFGAIRAKGGSNDNPNASQFKASYKRLLKCNNVMSSSDADCSNRNSAPILTACEDMKSIKNTQYPNSSFSRPIDLNYVNSNIVKQRPLAFSNEESFEFVIPERVDLSTITEDKFVLLAVTARVTDVQRKFSYQLKCPVCLQTITADNTEYILNVCVICQFQSKV